MLQIHNFHVINFLHLIKIENLIRCYRGKNFTNNNHLSTPFTLYKVTLSTKTLIYGLRRSTQFTLKRSFNVYFAVKNLYAGITTMDYVCLEREVKKESINMRKMSGRVETSKLLITLSIPKVTPFCTLHPIIRNATLCIHQSLKPGTDYRTSQTWNLSLKAKVSNECCSYIFSSDGVRSWHI